MTLIKQSVGLGIRRLIESAIDASDPIRSAHLFWCLTFWLPWDWWFEIAQHNDPRVIVREPNVVQAL